MCACVFYFPSSETVTLYSWQTMVWYNYAYLFLWSCLLSFTLVLSCSLELIPYILCHELELHKLSFSNNDYQQWLFGRTVMFIFVFSQIRTINELSLHCKVGWSQRYCGHWMPLQYSHLRRRMTSDVIQHLLLKFLGS